MRRSNDGPPQDVQHDVQHDVQDDDVSQPEEPETPRDGGFSFIEIIVTVVLMGVVLLPILVAVRTGVQTSVTTRTAADVETVLVNAVDRVYRADRAGPFACDVTSPVAVIFNPPALLY